MQWWICMRALTYPAEACKHQSFCLINYSYMHSEIYSDLQNSRSGNLVTYVPCWRSSLLCWQWHKMGLLEMGVPGYSICLPAPASKEGPDSHWRIPSLARAEEYRCAVVQTTIQRQGLNQKTDRGTGIIIWTIIRIHQQQVLSPTANLKLFMLFGWIISL